jgi:hypothetical protein
MPAGFPFGMPGIGELIEGAVQQAPQPGRQLTGAGEEIIEVNTGVGQRNSILPASSGFS